MKKIILGLCVLGFVMLYVSCEEENNPAPSLQEEELIMQITSAIDIRQVDARDLPVQIMQYVKQNHAPHGIEMAFLARNLGYEVILENGLCIYFNTNGNHLNHDGLHDDSGNHHGWGMSGSYCLFGDTLDLADLPQSALDYIADQYAGSTITLVVLKPSGMLSVELDGDQVLMFDSDGDFLHLCGIMGGGGTHGHHHDMSGGPDWQCDSTGFVGQGGGPGQGHHHHGGMGGQNGNMGNPNQPAQNGPCWSGSWVQTENLPAAITDYVNTHHPDATIIHAIQTYGGNYFLRLSDCSRLVFDENGNILFDSGD